MNDCKDQAIVSEAPVELQETVGESLNRRIKTARERVERLCIIKAKAEACGILDFPHRFIEEISYM